MSCDMETSRECKTWEKSKTYTEAVSREAAKTKEVQPEMARGAAEEAAAERCARAKRVSNAAV